jgi:hypothetical protein
MKSPQEVQTVPGAKTRLDEPSGPAAPPAHTFDVIAPDQVQRVFLRPLAGVCGEVDELPREQLEIDVEAIHAEIARGMRCAPGLVIREA